jgi:hypothetical protein
MIAQSTMWLKALALAFVAIVSSRESHWLMVDVLELPGFCGGAFGPFVAIVSLRQSHWLMVDVLVFFLFVGVDVPELPGVVPEFGPCVTIVSFTSEPLADGRRTRRSRTGIWAFCCHR